MKERILFVAGNVSVFDATPIKIFDYLKATSGLLEKPRLIGILDLKSFRDKKRREEVRKIFNAAGIDLRYTVRLLPVSVLVIAFHKIFGGYRKLYVNNFTAGINALLLKKIFFIKYTFDFHGSIPEERVLIGLWPPGSLKHRIGRKLERLIARNATSTVAISSAALSYLDLNSSGKLKTVIPCGVNFDPVAVTWQIRESKRDELGISDKFVVLYSGSVSPWNDYGRMHTAVQRILELEGDRFLMLILSKDTGPVLEEFVKMMGLNAEQYRHLSVDHGQVHLYTSCGDLALLIRKASIVNEISSPMKFGEYIGAGVPVLITKGIGDATGEVEQHQLGAITSNVEEDRALQEFITTLKTERLSFFDRCRSFAAENYRLSAVLDKYSMLYKS